MHRLYRMYGYLPRKSDRHGTGRKSFLPASVWLLGMHGLSEDLQAGCSLSFSGTGTGGQRRTSDREKGRDSLFVED